MKRLSRLLLIIVIGVAIGASVAFAYGIGYYQCRNAALDYVRAVGHDHIRTEWFAQYRYSFPFNHCWISIVNRYDTMTEIQLY